MKLEKQFDPALHPEPENSIGDMWDLPDPSSVNLGLREKYLITQATYGISLVGKMLVSKTCVGGSRPSSRAIAP